MIGKFILIKMQWMGLGRSVAQLSCQNKETIDITINAGLLEQKIATVRSEAKGCTVQHNLQQSLKAWADGCLSFEVNIFNCHGSPDLKTSLVTLVFSLKICLNTKFEPLYVDFSMIYDIYLHA